MSEDNNLLTYSIEGHFLDKDDKPMSRDSIINSIPNFNILIELNGLPNRTNLIEPKDYGS